MTTIAQQLEQLEQDMRDSTTPANGDPLVLPVLGASVRIWADRLSAIRAAVGGEAVAWAHKDGMRILKDDGEGSLYLTSERQDEYGQTIPLYTPPPATVDVGASAELLDLAANFETCIGFLPPTGQRNIDKNIKRLRELAALIDGAGNG